MSTEPTPSQREAILSGARTICVDAGAGSGKTRVLIARIVHLLNKGEDLDRIAAITFTEKAAAEMKARLRDAFRKQAAANAGDLNRWRDLERRVESARISTIHGFCLGFLRENALHIGLDPDFAVLADADATLLLRETVTSGVHALFEAREPAAIRLASELSMDSLTGVLRLMLGQGRVLDRLIDPETYADPAAIARHWADTAAREHTRRLGTLHTRPELRRWLCGMEQAAGRCACPDHNRERFRLLIIGALREILGGADARAVESALQRVAEIDMRRGRNLSKDWDMAEAEYETFKAVQDEVRQFARGLLPEDPDPALELLAAERTADLWRVYGALRAAHDRAKADLNALDFDDLIARTHDVLQASENLRRRTAGGFAHLLIDEFQDTDASQLAIARLLSDTPGGPALFIVGDAKQSIYLFRGAEVEVFQEQRGVSDTCIPLAKNFRTVPEVLAFVNDLFRESGLLEAVGDYGALEPARPAAGEPRVEVLVPDAADDDNAEAWRRAEAELIARRIQGMCGGGAPLMLPDGEGAERPARFGDIALLMRAMSHVHLYEEALRQASIPYLLVGGAGFYERQEVLDVLNLLKAVLDPWDESALFAFLRSPMAALSDDDLCRAVQDGGLAAAFDRPELPGGMAGASLWRRARELVHRLRDAQHRPLPEFMRLVLEETRCEAIALAQHLGLQRASNVRKLLELASDFTQSRPPTLRAFVAYLDQVRGEAVREGDAPVQPEDAGAVTIMTIHKAKGLEFPVVVIPDMSAGMNAGSAPPLCLHRALGIALKVANPDGERAAPALARAIADRCGDEEREEHARLLYVALTRARDCLVLSGSPDASKGSWLDALDKQYGVLSSVSGRLGGSGWQAVIHRSLPDAPAPERPPMPDALPARELLERWIEPVTAHAAARYSFSVSAVLDAMCGGGEPPESVRQAAGRPVDPRTRGTLVHLLFEQWDFGANRGPDPRALMTRASVPLEAREELARDLENVAARFAGAGLAAAMAADPGLEREAAFTLALDGALVNGKMDAVFSDGAVVDYKTGAPRPESSARYEKQVLLYAATVERLRGVLPARGVLWYVDTGDEKVVPVTRDRVAAVLEEARGAVARLREHAVPGAPAV